MAEWRKICAPVDFSESSRLAMLEAADIARRFDADLVVVHAVHPPDEFSSAPEQLQLARAELERVLERWRSEAERRAGRPVHAAVIEGDPAREIVAFVNAGLVDLVVLATHGRGGFKRFVLGSVAERVVREVACGVLVQRAARAP